jgi:hypothetical protein
MRHAVSFTRASVASQSEDRGLSKEVHRGGILVQICEDWGERLAGVQFLRRLGISGIHVHNEMRVWGKERHLTLRVAPVGAMRVGLDKFADSESISGFLRGDTHVFAHSSLSFLLPSFLTRQGCCLDLYSVSV